jgi:N-acetylglucosaminyldiphosphoundecaprenol N-acetyl-beta-D-mannosaminyltransferase
METSLASAAFLDDRQRALPAPAVGASELHAMMGFRCWDVALPRAAAFIVDCALRGELLDVYFVNAHCVNVAARSPGYAGLLARAPFVFADGVGMAIAARLLGERLEHNVNGTDLFPEICSAAAAARVSIAFLGARPGVADACKREVQRRWPGLDVAWVEHGFLPAEQEGRRLEALNASAARILFVAKGVPAQEQWIAAHRPQLRIPVVLGVGALLDFYSGAVRRAPPIIRQLRSEWVWRLLREPHRMARRYLIGNPEFMARALVHRARLRRHPVRAGGKP